jgi:purine-binding chemotaxis protein CheW
VIIELATEDERHDIGIVVDAVSEVLEVSDADIEPAPAFGAKIRADFIAGMGKIGGKFVDHPRYPRFPKVLSVDEIAPPWRLVWYLRQRVQKPSARSHPAWARPG